MASSRNRPPKPDPADAPLLSALRDAVEAAAAAATGTGAILPAPARRRAAEAPLAIALSAGPDSTALLHLAWRLRERKARGFARLLAIHVHHGLQPAADEFAAQAQRSCDALGIELQVCRVRVSAPRGLEDGARRARYEALAQAARAAGARLLLTGHNADDRIETFLLQWLRGAGLEGLAGMPEQRWLDEEGGVRLVRPLLEAARSELQAYVQRHGLVTVEDPSNRDPRYARNALRQQVLPALGRLRSGFRRSAARSIELLGEATELLQSVTREALAACQQDAPPGMLRIDALASLPAAYRPLVLRAWLAGQGVEAPSRARLREALSQALAGAGDGRMLVRLGTHELRRVRGLLCLRAASERRKPGAAPERFFWNGEPERVVGAWGGSLHFVALAADAAGAGFDAQWLRERPLELRARTGGERFKPHALRPSKRLKHLFQEAGVPEFERAALPLLWREDRLIFVAGLGGDARLLETGAGRVRIEWHGAERLLD